MKIDQTKLATKMRNEAPRQKALTDETSFQTWRFCGVLEHPSGLAEQPHDEQREERQVEEDEHRPEVPLAETLVHCFPVIFGSQ